MSWSVENDLQDDILEALYKLLPDRDGETNEESDARELIIANAYDKITTSKAFELATEEIEKMIDRYSKRLVNMWEKGKI